MNNPVAKAKVLLDAALDAQRSGDIERAFELYAASIATHPTAEAYTYRGWAHSHRKEYDKAIEDCRKAIALDPSLGNPYNDIGAYLIELGQADAALPWLERAVAAPRYEARAYPHFNKGRVFTAKGQLRKAARCFRAALGERPDFEPAKQALEQLEATLH